MGRKGCQKKPKTHQKSLSSSIEDLLINDSHYEHTFQSRYSPDSLKSLRKELKEAITQIYSKFFAQFVERKEKRISSQNPIYPISTEILTIETNYRNELTQKVKQLVHLDSLNDIYFTFCKSVNAFMAQIYAEMKEIRNSDPILQAVVLVEGYFVVENSCNELGKITSDIFDKQLKCMTCENVTKLAFLDQILTNFCELIENLRHLDLYGAAQDVFSIQKSLNDISSMVNQSKNKTNEVKRQSFTVEVTQSDSIDEIVRFINGESKENKKQRKRRRVSKVSTAETSGSPFDRRSRDEIWKVFDEAIQDGEVEREVQELQSRLELVKPCLHKLKPRVSDEWLSNIKTLILKNHSFANKFNTF